MGIDQPLVARHIANHTQPLVLDANTDVQQLSLDIVGQLQAELVATTHHLRCFLHYNPMVGVDVSWLQTEIEKRGGTVLDSQLGGESKVHPIVEKTMRYQWIHHFYQDALRVFVGNKAIEHYIGQGYRSHKSRTYTPDSINDPRLSQLVQTLFGLWSPFIIICIRITHNDLFFFQIFKSCF